LFETKIELCLRKPIKGETENNALLFVSSQEPLRKTFIEAHKNKDNSDEKFESRKHWLTWVKNGPNLFESNF